MSKFVKTVHINKLWAQIHAVAKSLCEKSVNPIKKEYLHGAFSSLEQKRKHNPRIYLRWIVMVNSHVWLSSKEYQI